MPAQVPPWFETSKHTGSINLRGQSKAADGVLTDAGTALNVTARLASESLSVKRGETEFSAITSARDHHITPSESFTYSVDVIRVNNGTDPTPLHTMFKTYDIIKVTRVLGTGTGSVETITFFITASSFSEGLNSKGSVIGSLSGSCVDTGATDFFTRAVV